MRPTLASSAPQANTNTPATGPEMLLSRRDSSAPPETTAKRLAAGDLATALGLGPAKANTVEIALRRFAYKPPGCREEKPNPRKEEPRTLYRVNYVWPFL